MEFNSGSNRASNFKSASRYALGRFEITSTITPIDTILKNDPAFPLNKDNLKKLFTFATSQTHFLFNGCFYDQIDGVAMGSPLAPILANLFMGHREDHWLNNYSDS